MAVMNPSVDMDRQARDGVFDMLTGYMVFENKSQMEKCAIYCYDGNTLHRL
jgi:hypothetical protein